MIAETPKPPYYAVIFTSTLVNDPRGYSEMSAQMLDLAKQQPGYLGYESARDGLGITVSYWENEEAIKNWKNVADHRIAQQTGREKWYKTFKTRVCKVERDYGFERK